MIRLRIDTAEFALAAHRKVDFVVDGLPQVAFVGRSNVGKSSLMNSLLKRKGLARTSNTPGRTRSVNYFLINRKFYFVDLPGYGYAKASKTDRRSWARLVEGYLAEAPANLDVLQLIDGKVGVTALDLQAYEYLREFGIEPQVVVTKIDKVRRTKQAAQVATIRRTLCEAEAEIEDEAAVAPDPMAVSVLSGDGIKKLWGRIGRNLH